MAKDVGFQKKHIDTLQRLVIISNIRHPLLLFTNTGLLDSVLKKGIYSIERQPSLSEGERIHLLNTIYEIKQTIEFNADGGSAADKYLAEALNDGVRRGSIAPAEGTKQPRQREKHVVLSYQALVIRAS